VSAIGTKHKVTLNASPAASGMVMKMSGAGIPLPPALQPTCITNTLGTCSLTLNGTAGYNAAVTKWGKTISCTTTSGSAVGGAVTGIDLTSSDQVLSCTVTP
jgi:hypothetical protein